MKSANAWADLPSPPPTPAAAAAAPCSAVPAQIESSTLFGTAQEVLIKHQGQTYRLRITSQGKLILTK